MRLLGKCPGCENEDTVYLFRSETGDLYDSRKVECRICTVSWESWLHLIWEEGKENNKLIPLEIRRMRTRDNDHQELGVQLLWPRIGEIPFRGVIISMLNTALIIRFSSRARRKQCFSMEENMLRASVNPVGGVEGYYKGNPIRLRNGKDIFGLYLARGCSQGEGIRRILDFYQAMLRYLFEAGPENVAGQYGRGEILRLSRDRKGLDRAWQIMLIMLSKVRNEEFATEVARRIMEIQPNPFSVLI